jgi:phage tail P2-like protein
MWNTIDIVPSSIRNDPQVQAACAAIDLELQQIYAGIPPICFWPNIPGQVSPMLDILMWEMHVDQWEIWSDTAGSTQALIDQQKRDFINNSIDWHSRKGTKGICDEMLNLVFADGEVLEWYQYGGAPYHFRITTRDANVDPNKQQQMLDSIMAVKNVRSWMDEFIRDRYFTNQNYLGYAVYTEIWTTAVQKR